MYILCNLKGKFRFTLKKKCPANKEIIVIEKYFCVKFVMHVDNLKKNVRDEFVKKCLCY
jgi:hypothetical protein